MKTRNATRSALFTSIISLLLCVSMLVGTTFAWFTDSVVSENNIIKSGNLDIELEYWNGEKWADVTDAKDILTGNLWEPGYVEVAYLRLQNAGSLALKYQMGINISSETTGINQAEEEFKLSDYIYFDVIEGINGETGAFVDRAAAMAVATENNLISAGYSKAGTLQPETGYTYLALIVHMPTTVDNVANHNGTDIPEINLGINVFATQFTSEKDSFDEYYDGAASWVTLADTDWYFENRDADEFTIYSAEELAGLAALVNGTAVAPVTTFAATEPTTVQDSFTDKIVKLGGNIDLAGHAWTSIGNWENVFQGTFDGQGYTISNLYINAPQGEGVGLFGVVENATIKNLTIDNAKIKGYSMVAAVAGAAYPAIISNCHVTGEINLVAEWAYVAGIAGYCYYGTQVDGCSVIAEGTGLIKSETRNAVGGITAWLLEGNHKVLNCQVENLDLVGWTNVGGITGFVHYNNTIDGCSVKNVNLVKTRVDGNPGIGLIAGGYSYSANNAITLSNNSVNDVTMSGTHIAYEKESALYGSEYGGATAAYFVLENNTVDAVENKLVVVSPIKNADALKAALTNGGDNYILTADIAVAKNETLTIASGVNTVIDLNGYKITGSADKTGNQELFLVKGNLTVKNGSIEMTAENNQGWNSMATVFDVTAGGVLNMKGVKATVSGTDMNFIVHLNNWGTATLNAEDCDFNASYVAIRAFNSGYDMNNITVKNSAFHGGRVFWVHNYTSEGKDDSTLNLSIYGNGNTTDNAKPVRYGFSESTYYSMDGVLLVDSAAALTTTLANGGTVALAADINMDVAETGFTVAKGKSVKIDLNGHDIIATGTTDASAQLFSVNGNLEIVGEGTISLTNDNYAWSTSYRYTAINIRETGVVTLGEGVKVVCEAGTADAYGMSYAVDIYTTGTLNVEGASLHSNYIAVRCFFGASVVNVNSGSITSSKNNWGIWPQSATGAKITIADGIECETDSYGIYIFK